MWCPLGSRVPRARAQPQSLHTRGPPMPRQHAFGLRSKAAPSLFLLVSLLSLLAASAHATEVIHLDTRALTLGSSDIVVGSVETITPRWNEKHTKIVTDV